MALNLANMRGSKGIKALRTMSENITDLKVDINEKKMAKVVADMLTKNTTVKTLHIVTSTNRPGIASALMKNQGITKLVLEYDCDGGIRFLTEMLKKNKTICHLDLVDSNVEGRDIRDLTDILIENQSLTYLNLDVPLFTCTGFSLETLCQLLKINQSVTTLTICIDLFETPQKMELLKQALIENDTVTELLVSAGFDAVLPKTWVEDIENTVNLHRLHKLSGDVQGTYFEQLDPFLLDKVASFNKLKITYIKNDDDESDEDKDADDE